MTRLHTHQPLHRFAMFHAMVDEFIATAHAEMKRTGKSYAAVRADIFANSTAGPMLRRAVDSRFCFVYREPI